MDIRVIQTLSDLEEEYVPDDYEEIMCNPGLGDDRIIITGPLARIRDTKLIIANGVYCSYDEDTGELEPDFGISLLYKAKEEPDLDKPLYWEQDPPAIMVHNYLNIIEGTEAAPEVETILRVA